MVDFLEQVRRTIERHALIAPGDTVVIGVSGGVDSLVLLHVLRQLREPLSCALHAATLDHGIRGAAGAADAAFVRQTAEAWGIPVTVGQADVPALAAARRLNLEDAARQVRYAFLARTARQVGAVRVAVGHHQDDQAETVLMHLVRGSGLEGLIGMLPAVPLNDEYLRGETGLVPPLHFEWRGGQGVRLTNADSDRKEERPGQPLILIRPLLDISRAEIAAYAAAHGLEPRHDATNDDPAYVRNRLRHDVIPLLETLNPRIRSALAHTAAVLQGDAELVHIAEENALRRVLREIQPHAAILDRAGWAGLSTGEKRGVLRAVIERLRPDLRDVGFVHIENARAAADQGTTGAEAVLPGGLRLRVSYDTLTLSETGADAIRLDVPTLAPGAASPPFTPQDRLIWPSGAWTFEAAPLGPGDDLPAIHADPLAAALLVPREAVLRLRTRLPGDRFQPRGLGGHSQKLSDTWINMHVPAEVRDQVPLLTVNDRIAWFVTRTADGLRARVAESFAVPEPPLPAGAVIVVVRWRQS